MKRFLIALFAVCVGALISIPDAEARRLGGGSSFGMQRDSGIFKRPSAPTPSRDAAGTPPRSGATATTPPKRSWMGPLAGLAAGLGIAALLSHFGLGEEFAGVVMLALLVFGAIFILRRLFGQRAPSPSMGYAGGPAPELAASRFEASPTAPAGSSLDDELNGFDVTAFEREAKLNFIRLQAASDAANLDDIRSFTTPEVYAEIAMQLQERGEAPNQTDVIELNAEVVDVSKEAGQYVVSVRFDGTLREERDSAPAAFAEIWHLVKPLRGPGGWRIAGIQQD